MEIVAPAGNLEKLTYAYEYGADAAYIGLKRFSLRVKADNFYEDEYKKIIELKKQYPNKKLFCALNITFHNKDIEHFISEIDYFKQYPIDSFIVQDIGMVRLLQKHFPNTALHLSTQANCINSEAVKMYRDLGFKRVVLGREASLAEIRQIKDAVPEMELEVFGHGAMCVSYSGRCLLSAYMNGRSANGGFCSHSCRWDYDLLTSPDGIKKLAQSGELVLREHQRPDEYFPVFEGENFTAILSSKDLCMINNIEDMVKAGVDSLKIEGRMKSIYYVALVTRAYRKAIDAFDGKISLEEAKPYIEELENVSHRECTTGFYYRREDADKTTVGASDSKYVLVAQIHKELDKNKQDELYNLGQKTYSDFYAQIDAMHPSAKEARLKDLEMNPEKKVFAFEKQEGWSMYEFTALNKIDTSMDLEFVSSEFVSKIVKAGEWKLINFEDGTSTEWTCNGHPVVLYTKHNLPNNTLVRMIDPDYKEGVIRDYGR